MGTREPITFEEYSNEIGGRAELRACPSESGLSIYFRDISVHRDGSEWVISVSDDGIGIDPDETDRVFDVLLFGGNQYRNCRVKLATLGMPVESRSTRTVGW